MISRAIALQDSTVTALTSCELGASYNLGAYSCGDAIYAGLQVLTCSTGGVKFRIQASSSSEFATATEKVAFTSGPGRTGQWQHVAFNPASATSTNKVWWRVTREMTTSGESYKALATISLERAIPR